MRKKQKLRKYPAGPVVLKIGIGTAADVELAKNDPMVFYVRRMEKLKKGKYDPKKGSYWDFKSTYKPKKNKKKQWTDEDIIQGQARAQAIEVQIEQLFEIDPKKYPKPNLDADVSSPCAILSSRILREKVDEMRKFWSNIPILDLKVETGE